MRSDGAIVSVISMIKRITATNAPAATILVRLMVGSVFLSEGIQKFMYSKDLGVGRFGRIGLPSPEILAPLVASFEIVCGSLILIGMLTRLAAIPLATIISVAIYATKIPVLLESGFWKMAHETRTDFSMFLGALFLFIVGAGAWSVDARLQNRATKAKKKET